MPFETLIVLAAQAAKISAPLLLAICTQETGLQNKITLQDGKTSSYGICQIKLGTARSMGYRGGPKGLMDPKTNANFRSLYVKFQLEKYGDWCKATAAYNVGRYNESQKSPGYPKNLKYVRKVQKRLEKGLQEKLSCDINKDYERNGTRLRIHSAKPKDNPNRRSCIQPKKCRTP